MVKSHIQNELMRRTKIKNSNQFFPEFTMAPIPKTKETKLCNNNPVTETLI